MKGTPKNGWFTMETPYSQWICGVPLFSGTHDDTLPGRDRETSAGPPGPLPRDRSVTPPRRLWAPCHRSWLHIHRSALPWP